MSLLSNMPNLNALPEDVIDEILGGEEFEVNDFFEINPQQVSQLTGEKLNTVWVNGCFDVVHAGHIAMLKYAKSKAQRLVVGLDTDSRVREFKGINRPINTLENRKTVMKAIRYVDQVVHFSTQDELVAQIRKAKANAIVVGEEYKGRVVGAEAVDEIIFFPRLYDLSTTKIIGG